MEKSLETVYYRKSFCCRSRPPLSARNRGCLSHNTANTDIREALRNGSLRKARRYHDAHGIRAFSDGGLNISFTDRCPDLYGDFLPGVGPDARNAAFCLRRPHADCNGLCQSNPGVALGLLERSNRYPVATRYRLDADLCRAQSGGTGLGHPGVSPCRKRSTWLSAVSACTGTVTALSRRQTAAVLPVRG